ncbi:hypothetical protein L1D55_22420 [Vibrio sp. Isolate22]|uniref:hypothetical protein n=1 Tax=Vibrio sp. Isolate22 TaxID=2908532 RepID=UPI001EFDA216|nr:hypothetical protein [Vibrio sp. Isolate22]MCG9694452.1 hypothetical protein [Vibrio sp. Isolate22]
MLTDKNRQIKEKLVAQARVKKSTKSVPNYSRLKKIELINSSLLVILTILAFVVNLQLSSVQKTLIEKQTANEVQKFWSEVERTVDKSSDYASELGSKTVDFIGAIDNLSLHYYMYYVLTPTKSDVKSDNKFLSLKAEVLSKYGALISSYSRVSLEYDFILLKYHDIAVANDIKQWAKLRLAREKVNSWKLANTNTIDELLVLSNTLESIKTESEFLEYTNTTYELSKSMGESIEIFIPPYVLEIDDFIDANIK